MKAIRCSNGHWYDSETYDKCPHCGQPTSVIVTVSNQDEKAKKKGFSLFKKEKSNKKSVTTTTVDNAEATDSKVKSTASVTNDEVTERFFADIDDDKTMSMFEANEVAKSIPLSSELSVDKSKLSQKNGVSEPLSAAVQRASAMDEGKTLSYFNAMTTLNASSPDAMKVHNASDPVVGWLVAVSGVHFGESFQLYVGKNTIGRSSSNKVVLGLDQSISRENHATIIYEPKRKEFYLQSGIADGLIYLNDSFVNGSQLMKSKDILEIGSSKLILIPLCGIDFTWEQYM